MTSRALRWAVSALVTIAAFGSATWISGELLPTRDAGVRWGIASGLGVALAALAALWGHSYATAESHRDGDAPSPARRDTGTTGATSNSIRNGDFRQAVIQGRDIQAVSLTGSNDPNSSRSGSPLESKPSPPTAPAADNSETRNVIDGGTFGGPVVQGRNFGPVSLTELGTQTGDQSLNSPQPEPGQAPGDGLA